MTLAEAKRTYISVMVRKESIRLFVNKYERLMFSMGLANGLLEYMENDDDFYYFKEFHSEMEESILGGYVFR